ncbi:hypothetical protein OUZ56_003303 [Daphnia magna]|uniref:Uncharacterized protein n=1 Tax=Daphnia magna TaxID=35525 RepID=A0ABR0A8B8_9CRUS|nr:hypothetical protein OUZ56_003303 [Daphnia magna]
MLLMMIYRQICRNSILKRYYTWYAALPYNTRTAAKLFVGPRLKVRSLSSLQSASALYSGPMSSC